MLKKPKEISSGRIEDFLEYEKPMTQFPSACCFFAPLPAQS